MALIRCKECGKEISDQAKVCPNCNYDVRKQVQEAKSNTPEGLERKKKKNMLITLLVVFALVGLIWFVIDSNNRASLQRSIDAAGAARDAYEALERN